MSAIQYASAVVNKLFYLTTDVVHVFLYKILKHALFHYSKLELMQGSLVFFVLMWVVMETDLYSSSKFVTGVSVFHCHLFQTR